MHKKLFRFSVNISKLGMKPVQQTHYHFISRPLFTFYTKRINVRTWVAYMETYRQCVTGPRIQDETAVLTM
jgi:hypothetical protein